VAALDLPSDATVVEIGPGLGALTVFLAPGAGRLVALERDPALAAFLRNELFAQAPHVEVRCQDALEFDFTTAGKGAGGQVTVVGNLPYQITSPLLFKLMDAVSVIRQAVFMVQKEVGDRLLAPLGAKDYGILTVLGQYYFRIRRLFTLGPGNFYPPPQVDSVVLDLRPPGQGPRAQDEARLRQIVKAAFAQRRKTLNNTLVARAAALGLAPERVREVLRQLDIDSGRRGETLRVADFVHLANALL
jgi:16S rRNA (adenine1518-N6/adenine1519-N6)-dimethyltransferase